MKRHLLLLIGLSVSVAFPARAAQRSLVHQGEQAELEGRPKEALDLYRAAIAARTGPAAVRIAQTRIDWIETRSVNDFRPLSDLLRLRGVPFNALKREDLVAFEATIPTIPQGPLREDARAFVASSWLNRLHDPVQAERAARAWLQDSFPDKGTRELATQVLAQSRQQQGYTRDALHILKQAGYGKHQAYLEMQPLLAAEIGRPISFVSIALFILLAAFVLLSRWNTRAFLEVLRPSNLLLPAYALLIPGYIAIRFLAPIAGFFEHAFVSVGAVSLASLFVGAALRERPAPRLLTVFIAVTAVLACMGAGFLAFQKSELIESLFLWRGL